MSNAKNTAPMIFEVKAYNGTQRRFENLDNLEELNDFCNEWGQKGFTKFIVKAFDVTGLRSTNFFTAMANTHGGPALGGHEFCATRIAKIVA
jgi:hypothetical protein|tara:strand:- start:216 stop:491 length:276 start_codon:yes stop_codon:yes gene_type:complete